MTETSGLLNRRSENRFEHFDPFDFAQDKFRTFDIV